MQPATGVGLEWGMKSRRTTNEWTDGSVAETRRPRAVPFAPHRQVTKQ